MPKKNWTDKERKAFGAKMKAARENNTPKPDEEIKQPTFTEVPKETILDENDLSALLRRVQELESSLWRQSQQPQPEGAVGVNNGKLTGTYEKYKVAADLYPNPVERLKVEPKLARFAFPLNYELLFQITESNYETIDGIRMKEPKFTLDLIRIMLDEETGEPTNGRYTICRLVMHEDPDAALVIARDNGIDVEAEDEETFLNEMRYLRMRDWLLECFYPAPIQKVQNKRDMVINGQLVEYFEVNSESASGIPFAQLDAKKKLRG